MFYLTFTVSPEKKIRKKSTHPDATRDQMVQLKNTEYSIQLKNTEYSNTSDKMKIITENINIVKNRPQNPGVGKIKEIPSNCVSGKEIENSNGFQTKVQGLEETNVCIRSSVIFFLY